MYANLGSSATTPINPTSGVVPVNLNGVLLDSNISSDPVAGAFVLSDTNGNPWFYVDEASQYLRLGNPSLDPNLYIDQQYAGGQMNLKGNGIGVQADFLQLGDALVSGPNISFQVGTAIQINGVETVLVPPVPVAPVSEFLKFTYY